jgi:hypothetical protein
LGWTAVPKKGIRIEKEILKLKAKEQKQKKKHVMQKKTSLPEVLHLPPCPSPKREKKNLRESIGTLRS